MSQTSHIDTLMRRQSNRCHYCDCLTFRKVNGPALATKEHIVPRAFGGANDLSNYVMACSRCNNKRGTSLFFCSCDTCGPKIAKALENQKFIDDIFNGIIAHNRPRVYRHQKDETLWIARFGHHRRSFPSWKEAMTFAIEHEGLNINGV